MKKSLLSIFAFSAVSFAAFAQDKVYTSMSEALVQPSMVKVLVLREQQLTDAPIGIEKFQNLEVLDLSGNRLTKFPNKILALKKLKALTLKGNRILELPNEITLLQNLEELYISNGLARSTTVRSKPLPAVLSQMKKLRILDMGNWNLTEVPVNLKETAIEELYLYNNAITELPETIFMNGKLRVLDVSNNQLTRLPENVDLCPNLRVLNLSGNQLTELPENISLNQNLRYLHVAENKFLRPIIEVKKMILLNNMAYLNMSNIGASDLPVDFSALTNLEELDMSNNHIKSLPITIGQMRKLQKLNLSHNALLNLPISIGQLSALTHLDASHNQLTALPDLGTGLKNLSLLDVSYNEDLASYSDNIRHLQHIKLLNIKKTNLNTFQLQRLSEVMMSCNLVF